MFNTPDNVVLYTQEDIDTIKAEAQTTAQEQFKAGTDYGIRCTTNDINAKVLAHFKEVASGAMDTDEVVEAYNDLARALGWETVTTLNTLYTVTVEYDGYTIAEFSEVEANDEDSAVSEVRSNIEIEDISMTFSLSYNGQACEETIPGSGSIDPYDFEYSATEEY